MSQLGVLVITHGSRSRNWVRCIEQTVKNVKTTLPIYLSFLELVPNRTIEDGLAELISIGVKRIIVIPLFITMGSTHLQEIQYALGIIPKPGVKANIIPISHSAQLFWCSPLEDHDLVKRILKQRITALSENPTGECLLLVGHGSECNGFQEHWELLLGRLCSYLKNVFHFETSSFATLHPDTIQTKTREFPSGKRVITIPVFLSEGYFTKSVIPRKLAGNVYDGRTLLPSPLISLWMEETIKISTGGFSTGA